ncbi:hypothetical protein F5X99DRAFT_398516 [Biscogniauxia marginata]|nr:hypothetical protein F5X99DRAFT_398516 [Biscogniauxia marginata]
MGHPDHLLLPCCCEASCRDLSLLLTCAQSPWMRHPISQYFRCGLPKIPIAEAELGRAIQSVKAIKVPYGESFILELRRGAMDAFVALLISQLPNLESLYPGKNFTRESRFVGMILRSSVCEPTNRNSGLPTFKCLRDVSAIYFALHPGTRPRTDTGNIRDVLPLFYLPSVRRIVASIDNPATFTWPATYPPDPTNLSSLDLTIIREGSLGHVLSATRGLKALSWDLFRRDEDNFHADRIDLDQIIIDLSHVQSTLTDLTISAAKLLPVPIIGNLKPLVGFEALKRLEIPIPSLLGYSPDKTRFFEEVLPRNLEFLTITDDMLLQWKHEWTSFSLWTKIRVWLTGDWKTYTPHLWGLNLLLRMKDAQWGPNMKKKA